MKYLPLIVVLGLLSACGSSEPPAPPPPQKTVFDPMTDQLHKVEQKAATLPDERKDTLDKAIDGSN